MYRKSEQFAGTLLELCDLFCLPESVAHTCTCGCCSQRFCRSAERGQEKQVKREENSALSYGRRELCPVVLALWEATVVDTAC